MTLRSRLLLLVTVLMLASVLATLGLIRFTYSGSFARQQKQLTAETLNLASRLIKYRYDEYIDRRYDLIRDRRTALQNALEAFLATMQSEFAQSQRHGVTPEEAKRMVLAAARESGSRTGLNFFVFDHDFNGLVHSDPALDGKSWRNLSGPTGPHALEFSRQIVDRDGHDCTILEWPPYGSAIPRRHLTCLAAFPAWGWYAGVSENFARIESRSLHERDRLIHDVLASLSDIRPGAPDSFFVMERRGSSILSPGSGKNRALLLAHADDIDIALGNSGSPARLEWITPEGDQTVFVQYMPALNWNVGILMNSSELAAPANTLLKRHLLALLTVFLLGLALAWLLTRRVTAPFDQLVKSIRTVDPRQSAGQHLLTDLRALALNHPGETGQVATAWVETLCQLDSGLTNLEKAHRELQESKQAQESLNLELENRVALRTSALEAANQRLRESEARYRSLFMNSPTPFLEFDFSYLARFLASGPAATALDFPAYIRDNPMLAAECARLVTVLDANPAAVEFFEAGKRNRLMEELQAIITPRTIAELREMIAQFRAGATSYQNNDALCRTFRDNSRHCVASARPLPGHETSLDRVLLSIQDVTPLREGEDRLRSLTEAAQAANRTKSEFLANMSHEIRTPLNAILGLAELSQRQKDPEKTSVHLEMIADSAKTLLCVIGDVLDLSRVETGVLSLAEKDFDLSWTVNRALAPFRAACAAKNVDLTTEIQEGTPRRLRGDPVRLGQVLANLIGNAVKFTEQGAIRLRVTEDSREADHAVLRFCVQDTGVGIAPELTGMIFESFRQADSSFSKSYQGAGLGLAVCRELAALMGGTIWVESEPGQGSTFCFTASLKLSTGKPMPFLAESGGFDEASSGLSILIAEDNPINRHVFKETLNSLGHEVVLAADGFEALASLRKSLPDLVFMDVQMPRMDGLETVRRIRAGECGPEATRIPVVALTAYAMQGDRELFLEAGMTGYLAKPVTMDALQESVLQHTGKHPRGRAGFQDLDSNVSENGRRGGTGATSTGGDSHAPAVPPEAGGSRQDGGPQGGARSASFTGAPRNGPDGPTGSGPSPGGEDARQEGSTGSPETAAPVQPSAASRAREAFGPLMGEFLGFLRERADEAGSLLEAGEFDQAAKAGHAVKGTSMFCGLEEINVLGAQIERAARDGDLPAATRAVRELQKALSELDGEGPPANPRSMA